MSEMNYRGPAYLDELDTASRWSDRKDSFALMAQALLAAEDECEKLRAILEKYCSRYGGLNHIEQGETK